MSVNPEDLITSHLDAVDVRNRFSEVTYNGVQWDLAHLNPFALRIQIEQTLLADVVVLFSCHCFTHSKQHDLRVHIPVGDFYRDGWDERVLNPERYRLSQLFLPRMIRELPTRRIRMAAEKKNFVTMEATDSLGKAVQYAVFFAVEKDNRRKRRLLLRVQSAYPIEHLSRRQEKAGKVNFEVLLRAAYNGRRIRG